MFGDRHHLPRHSAVNPDLIESDHSRVINRVAVFILFTELVVVATVEELPIALDAIHGWESFMQQQLGVSFNPAELRGPSGDS